MSELVFALLVFLFVGSFFLLFHMLIGKMIRPSRPDAEKLTIYECGEPAVGSAWIQFDLRYYVVALLFVVFDVEVAFFFPWAVVFGKSNEVARNLDGEVKDLREELKRLYKYEEKHGDTTAAKAEWQRKIDGVADLNEKELRRDYYDKVLGNPLRTPEPEPTAAMAKSWAWVALFDLLVFFGVLMVGFAYLWKRGDIDWVRALPEKNEGAAELPLRPV